jgi:hypothetical protein
MKIEMSELFVKSFHAFTHFAVEDFMKMSDAVLI